MQDTTRSLELEKEKWTHYLKKQKIIVGHSDKKVHNQLFSLIIFIVSTCMEKQLWKYIYMKVQTDRIVFSLL